MGSANNAQIIMRVVIAIIVNSVLEYTYYIMDNAIINVLKVLISQINNVLNALKITVSNVNQQLNVLCVHRTPFYMMEIV